MPHIQVQLLRMVPIGREVRSRHLPAFRIDGQEEGEDVFFADARQQRWELAG